MKYLVSSTVATLCLFGATGAYYVADHDTEEDIEAAAEAAELREGAGEDGEIKFSLDPFETETQFLFGSFSVLFCNMSKYLNTVDFDSSIFTLSSSFNNLIPLM